MSAFPLSGTVELTCMLCLRVTLQPCITSLSTTSPTRSVRAKSSMTDKVQVSLFYSDSFLMCFKAGDILKRHMHGINLMINQFIILLYLPSSVNKLEVRHIFHSMFESFSGRNMKKNVYLFKFMWRDDTLLSVMAIKSFSMVCVAGAQLVLLLWHNQKHKKPNILTDMSPKWVLGNRNQYNPIDYASYLFAGSFFSF